MESLRREVADLRDQISKRRHDERLSIIVFSGEYDRLFAAFTIANGALALGKEVHMFFTFWGTAAIRNGESNGNGSLGKKLMSMGAPKDASGAPLSRMNMVGLSKKIMEGRMKSLNIDDLPTLIGQAREMGAKIHCCDTSMQMFGLTCDDLMEGKSTSVCGVSTFLSIAFKSGVTLFI